MEPNPWKDFQHFYLELGNAISSEVSHEGLRTHLEEVSRLAPDAASLRSLVKYVVGQFSGQSKPILFRMPEFFETQSILVFQGVDFDLSEQWKSRVMWRQSIWEWVERLFVIGNVCLHPNRKDKFLQVVRQLKMQQQQREVDSSMGAQEEPQEEDIQGVVSGMAQMFGLPADSPMNEFMSDLAVHMQHKMTETDNPMALLQSMMSGDMSVLDDVNEKIQAKIEAKIESGELTEEDFQRQQEGMMQNFGGISGLMQMANSLGLQNSTEEVEQAITSPEITEQRIEQLRRVQQERQQQQQQQRQIEAPTAQRKTKKKSKGKKQKK